MSTLSSPNDLLSKDELLLRLEEAEETLRAIRSGEVDALVVSGAQGDQVFTLKDATLPYQILIEEMNEGALTLSPQGIILYCNARFAEMLGLPLQSVLGQSFLHLVIPGDLVRARELLEHRPDRKSRGELTLLGSQLEVPVGISLKEIKLDSDMRLGVVITDLTERKQTELQMERYRQHLEELVAERTAQLEATNAQLIEVISKRKQAEEQLERSNQKLNEILVSIQDDLYVLDRDWNFVYANRLFASKVGKQPEDFVGKNIWEMFPKHVGTLLEENFRATMEKREIRRFEIGGKYTSAWYRMTAFPSAEGITVLGTDITERRRAEEALRKSEARFRRFYESGLLGVIFWNMDGSISDANDRFLEMVGYDGDDLAAGRIDWINMTPPEHRHLDEASTRELQATGVNKMPFEKEYIRKDGSRVPVLVAGAMLDEARVNGVAFVLDITARKQAEEALLLASLEKQASEYARSLIEVSIDPLVTISPEGKVTDVNEATVKATGVPREELIGTDFSSYFTEPEKAEQGYRQAFAQGFVTDYPLTIRHRDGHLLMDVLYNASLYKDAHGNVLGVFAAARDVTARVQAHQYTRSLIEASLDPLVTISPEGKITDVNEATIKATGVPREELIGTDFSSYFTEPIEAERGYKQVYAQGFVIDYPLTIRHRDGHLMDVLYNANLYKDTHGQVLGVFAGARDVTIQKQVSQYARSLIEVSIDPMVTISPEGKITDVNEATVRATGVPREELVGTNFSSYFTEPEKAEQGYQQVFAQGYATDYPLTIRHRDGGLMDVFYNASLYKDATGNILGAFAAARDVTAQKQAEAELKRHKDNLEILVKERTSELEESSRALSRSNENLEQFAYAASHDLQEPLRTMSSYSQLLERRYKGRLDKDADEFIEFIVDAAARMQKLITDLLMYSRAGRETTDMVPVDCDKLVRRLISGMAVTLESADGCVTLDSLPSVIGRESSLNQLFQNLIGNALKFRGEQPPRIHVSARQADGEWVFSVRDNGIGIEPQYSQRIFIIFQRLHARNEYPGTGIGLSICKKIVENMGGRIWVESEPGKGSTFYFTIPTQKAS